MKTLFKIIGILSISLLFMNFGLSSGAQAKDVQVGAIINLTGPASSWGQFHAKGQQDYTRYVNEVKGGVAGNKIHLTVVDHAYKPPEAVKFVKKFCTEDKVDLINTWDGGSGIMAKPIFQEYKVPTINYSTVKQFIQPPLDYAYLPFADYDMDSYAVLEYIKTIHKGSGPPKVGLLTYNNPYGKAIHDPSKEYAKKYNVNIVGIEEFPPQTLDLSTELLKLKNAGAEYVFVQILPSGIILALQSADKISYNAPFFATWTCTDPDFFKRGQGIIRDRLFAQFCGGLPVDGTPGVKLIQELMNRYKTVEKFDFSYWEGVVMGMLVERAAQRANEKFKKIDSESINQALQSFRNEDFGGLVPNITYTDNDHSGSWVGRMIKLNEDQTYTPMTSFWAPGREGVRILK